MEEDFAHHFKSTSCVGKVLVAHDVNPLISLRCCWFKTEFETFRIDMVQRFDTFDIFDISVSV